MTPSRRGKLLVALVVVAGLGLATIAVSFAVVEGDPSPLIFRQAFTGRVLLALIVWSILAWAARRLIVGKLPKASVSSSIRLIWGSFRIILFIATMLVLLGLGVSLAIGLSLAPAFFQAFISLLIFTAFTGIAGGAVMNSAVAFRRRTDPA